MSRPPRILSDTGLYHVIFRGLNRQNIFEEKEDYQKLKEIIKKVKEEKKFELYAYCMMTNHVHLFLKEENLGDIKKIMHKILTTYVVWYNRKYQRSGSLIGNRYKSEPIEDENYYFELIRYIHQNPVKAGLIQTVNDYKWSSYNEYIKQSEDLVDINFTLEALDDDKNKAISYFIQLHQTLITDACFSLSDTKKLTDEQLKRKIFKVIKMEPSEIAVKEKTERNELLFTLRRNGFTIGQLERLTGVSRGIISRV